MLNAVLNILRRKPSSLELLRERRGAPRRPSGRPLLVLARGRAFLARCLDESATGVRFECPGSSVLRSGDRIELSTTERGRVAWVRKLHGAKQVGVRREGAVDAPDERREFVRVAVPVTASCGGQEVEVLDLSLGGVKILARQPFSCSELTLELYLPGPPLRVRARVQENLGNTARLSLPWLDENSKRRLAEFLVSYLPV